MLFTAPGRREFISGVIMYDETIRQKSQGRHAVRRAAGQAGDDPRHQGRQGREGAARLPQEKITEGLDGLRERLQEYHELGARFAKWRAVIDIGAGIPTAYCIRANAQALARYAALCQEAGHRADRRAGSADGRRATTSAAASR